MPQFPSLNGAPLLPPPPQVDVNARENRLSGVSVEHSPFALVVVEGGVKGMKRYKKLMLHRIDWAADGGDADPDEEEGGAAAAAEPRPPNYCRLAWEGSAKVRGEKEGCGAAPPSWRHRRPSGCPHSPIFF